MSEFRVTKGWSLFGATDIEPYITKSREERTKYDRRADKMIRSLKTKSLEDFVKEIDAAAAEKKAQKAKYDAAVKEGKIKPKKKNK